MFSYPSSEDGWISAYSLPALPNSCVAKGIPDAPRLRHDRLSLNKVPRLLGNMFSKPTIMTQSAAPWETAYRALCRSVEPVERLLLTL